MQNNLIFLPLLVQVLLTLAVYVHLALAKSRAVKRGDVDLERRAMYSDAWPEHVQQINNNIRNQFEVPVLFYVLVITLHATGSAGLVAQILAWLFVCSRVVHAWIQNGSNHLPIRRAVFTFGCLVLMLMLFVTVLAVL